jgi:hypothetical protein
VVIRECQTTSLEVYFRGPAGVAEGCRSVPLARAIGSTGEQVEIHSGLKTSGGVV